MLRVLSLASLAAIVFFSPCFAAEESAEKAHQEIWRRFIDKHNILLDYADLDGSIVRPTPEDCRKQMPSALSWGVPNEDGPMFNGLYLDGICNRWKLSGKEEDRAKARRLVEGLLFLASVGKTPGFIARGVATDGKTTYPMGSNDQTMPWLYGMWRYVRDGLPQAQERPRIVARFCDVVAVLDRHQWRMPCDEGPSPFRGSFARHDWEAAPRLLFTLKAMHEFTRDARWQQRYLDAVNEKGGKSRQSRLDICRTGMVFDPIQGHRHSWTGSVGVVALRALWEMETDPALRDAYLQGLRASAELSAKSLPLCQQYDVNNTAHFEHDWRVMREAWKPQHSEADAVAVANAGLRVQGRASPRLHLEKNFVREPCFAAWVVTLCPDLAVVRRHAEAIRAVIAHYRVERLYLSQFFPIESAAYRLRMAEARAVEPIAVEVSAGAHDREGTVVTMELPAALRGSTALALTEADGGRSVPVQVDGPGNSRAAWIVREKLAAGKTRRYRLATAERQAAPSDGVSVTDDSRQLLIKVAAKPVLVYHQAVVPSPNPKEPYYARSGQLHPVYNPSGQVLTDDFNPDHTHQHGIMFAWRKSTFEGKPSDCWDQKGGQGRIEHVRTEVLGGGPVFGFFNALLRHSSLSVPDAPKPMLDETWRLRVYNFRDRFLFDLESTQTCAGKSPLVVEEYLYGGMAVRGSAVWFRPKPTFDFLTSEGKNRDGDQTRPRWVDFFGPIAERPTGMLVMGHPGNFRFPQPVRLHPKSPYFCFAPAALGDFSIEPGKPYVSRYRFCVHDGKLGAEIAERLWHDYADPPRVSVVADEKRDDKRG